MLAIRNKVPIHTSPPTARAPARAYFLDEMISINDEEAFGAAYSVIDENDLHIPHIIIEIDIGAWDACYEPTLVKSDDAPRFTAIHALYEFYKDAWTLLHPDHKRAPPSHVRRLLYFYAFDRGPQYMLEVLGKTVFPPRAACTIRRYALAHVYRPKANHPAPFAASAMETLNS